MAVTSTREHCLGASCPALFALPRRCGPARCAAADVVVVDHHLLLADLALKDEGSASSCRAPGV
jgi:ATP-dependent DNA helicase DinG